MVKKWKDPTKQPAADSTMKMEADFDQFTTIMKRIVTVAEKEKPKPASSSPAPAAS